MSDRYIEVDSGKFETFLSDKGFNRTLSNDEVVYVREHADCKGLFVKVYTSIRTGESVARDCGADAIRVVAIFSKNDKSYGVGKFPRVYRTGSQEKVHERTGQRIEAAFARCDEWLKEKQAQWAERKPVVIDKPTTLEQTKKTFSVSPQRVEYIDRMVDQVVKNEYIGKLGDEIQVCVEVMERKPWNDKFLFTMKTSDGHTITYWSQKDILQVGEKYDIRCRITGYNTFKGVKQTNVTECRGKRVVM